MKKVILFLVLCVALFQIGFAQNQHVVDSLLKVLPTTKEDSNRAKILINLSRLYFQTDPEKCFAYANQALILAQKLTYKKVIIRSYQNISIYYVINNDYTKATDFCQKAITVAKELNDKEALCDLLNIMATVSNYKGEMEASLQYGLDALKVSEEIKDTVRMVIYNVNAAADYQNRSDYVTAQKYLLKALKLNEIIKDKRGLANTYFIISKNYLLAENDTLKALESGILSLNYSKEAEDHIQEAQTLDLLGTLYRMKKEWEIASTYYMQALKKNAELGIEDDWGTYYNLGELYREQGKIDTAVAYFEKSMAIGEKIEDIDGMGTNYYGLGQAYRSLNDFRRAIEYLKKGLAISRSQSSPAHEREILQALSANYASMSNYEPAYRFLVDYNRLNDSISGKEILKSNADMREKYESEKKEQQIALLTKDKEIQQGEIKKQKLLKNSFIGGLALIALLSLFVFNNYRIRNKLRLEGIRNKIASDLHDDIGSTLNSISVYSEVAKQKSPTVVSELEHIGEASRKIIDALSDIVWTINSRNDTFEQIILRLRSLTYNLLRAKNIEHTFRADESLNDMKLSLETRRNFYLIFKEALNNLVKYSHATSASISLTYEDNLIIMRIRDNGVGFDTGQMSMGNGLLNMRSRAEEMKAKLNIESEPGNGTQIELRLQA